MDSEGMRSFFGTKCKLIVDATHPYAAIVTENIKQAVYAFNRHMLLQTIRRIAAYQKISNMCVLKRYGYISRL
ncbi:MAG: precorrin-6A/cobalt-precorrin-6A reductase [Agathobacter rectalis]